VNSLAQQNSVDPVEALVRRYWGAAHRAAYMIVQDAGAAEDIAQESMIAAVERLDRFDRGRPFGPWLHKIVVNRSIDWVRARNRRGEVSDDRLAEAADPGQPPDLSGLPDSLDPEDRAVVALRHVFDYDSREIARMLGMPPATVRTRLRRALARLRPLLAERAAAVVLAGVTALLAIALLTPPGRAALSDAAALLGEIGGSPASDGDEGLESTVPPGEPGAPTVVDNGEAPDGSRYEWVAYRREERLSPRVGARGKARSMDMFCVRFAWADAPRRQGSGGCGSVGGWWPGLVGLSGRLVRPTEAGGTHDRDYLMIGRVDPRVGRLRIVYRRHGGDRREVPVDLARVDGDLLRRAGGGRPFAVFTAFIPSALIREDRLGQRHRLMSLSVVDPTFRMPLPYSAAYKRCVRRHGGFFDRGWVDLIAYDRGGERVATLPTRTARPKPAACEGIEQIPDGAVSGPYPKDR